MRLKNNCFEKIHLSYGQLIGEYGRLTEKISIIKKFDWYEKYDKNLKHINLNPTLLEL